MSENGEVMSNLTAAKLSSRSASSVSLATSEADTNDSSSTNSANHQQNHHHHNNHIGAPQLKIAEDGTIVINEESLVIQRETVEPVYDRTIVESEVGEKLTYNSYRKFHHSKKWMPNGMK